MKFAMITTFFGAHSFGGDAAYVDRLSQALLRDGHQVDVIYNQDSFELLANGHPPRAYQKPENLRLFPLKHRLPFISQLMVHQTGKPALYKSALKKILQQNTYDVIHFHNISLIGGPGLFGLETSGTPIKIMTVHEHWLQCPLSLLWQDKKQICKKPHCLRCTLGSCRPPQWWRLATSPEKKINQLDALICPSIHTRNLYNLSIPVLRLPYCLPDKWMYAQKNDNLYQNRDRAYFAAAGRLVVEKGFQNILVMMRKFPDVDLLIAGTGPLEQQLRHEAPSNVKFLGLLGEEELASLFRHSIAVIMPSLFYETFGYVALEAFATKTPVILRNVGALPELIATSGAGFVYTTDEELEISMRTIKNDAVLRNQLGEHGFSAWQNNWSEPVHLKMYYSLLQELAQQKHDQ